MLSFANFIGKTVEKIDDSCQDYVVFHFTDGTKIGVYADCGSMPSSIPFFDFDNA